METLTDPLLFEFVTMQESGNLCNTLLNLVILNIHHLLQRVKLRYSHLPVTMLPFLGPSKTLSFEGWLFELDVILWLRNFSKVLFCIKI